MLNNGQKIFISPKEKENERNVLASKNRILRLGQLCRVDKLFVNTVTACSNQQSNKIMPTGPSYSDNREDHSDNFQYDPSDSDSSGDHSQSSEQHNDNMSFELSSSDSSEPPDYEVQQILP